MAKSRVNGMVKLKVVIEKLRKSLLLAKTPGSIPVPDDVKEGHFAVIAIDDGESKRFVVSLNYLTHPTFLRLLEQTAEEFGFDHEGALTIHCQSSELERILAEQWKESDVGAGVVFGWDSCKTMVKSC